jgi:hypothetical protein
MKSRMKPALRALPAAQVQISMPVQGVLRDVRRAFLGLCIDAGQKVLAALMESDRIALCGAKGVPDAQRSALRGGSTASQVVLGGQRIAVRRPRARSLTEGELSVPSFEWAASCDPLDAATMAAIAAGVSTRRYASTQEPVPASHQPRAASKSAVSRRFVQLSQEQLAQWLARPLGDLDLPVVMIDGIHFRDRVILLVLGIDAPGPQARSGLAGRLHRGHARGGLAAVGPGRSRARCRAHAAVGRRRRQGAAQGHRADLRCDGADPALPGAQAPQRAGAFARGYACQRQAGAEGRLVGIGRRPWPTPATTHGDLAAGQAPGRSSQPAPPPASD